jgi:hypothetical protein
VINMRKYQALLPIHSCMCILEIKVQHDTITCYILNVGSNKPKTGFKCKFTFNPMTCPICDNFLQDPQMVSCCNKNFCNNCIEQVKERGRPCPMCSEGGFDYQPNMKFNKLLLQCNVNCTMKCGWSGPLEQHDKHVNIRCSKVADQCVYCKKRHRLQRPHITLYSFKFPIVNDITCRNEVFSKWEAIGKELNLSDDTLQDIRRSHLESDMYTEMLEKWMESANNPSWEKLLTAFRKPTVNLNRLAAIIEQGNQSIFYKYRRCWLIRTTCC